MPNLTRLPILTILAILPLAALARTDFSGCTSFTSTVTVNPTAHEYGNVYGSVVYYDPDTLEICTVPDCGGGRAPPKTGVPGCPLYSGTATVTPSFLSADPLAPTTTTTTSSGAAETTTAAPSSGDGESSSSASSTSVVVVTGTDGSVNATGGSGTAQATRSSTVTQGSSTGSATGSPSSSVDASSGASSKVAVGGLSAALGLVVAFLL